MSEFIAAKLVGEAKSSVAKINNYRVGQNLLNTKDANVQLGYYVDSVTGLPALSAAASAKYNLSGYIPVQAGTTYRRSIGGGPVGFYNESFDFLSADATGATTFTPPEGTSFVRVSINRAGWSKAWVRLDGESTLWAPYNSQEEALSNPFFGTLRRTNTLIGKRLLGESAQIVINLAGDSYTQNAARWAQGFTEEMVDLYGDAGGGWCGFGWYSSATVPPFVVGGNQPTGINGNARPSLYPVRIAGSPTASYNTTVSPDLSLITMETDGDAVEVGFPSTISAAKLFFVGTSNGVIRYTFNGGLIWTTVNVQGAVGALGTVDLLGFPAAEGTLKIERVSGSCKLCGVDLRNSSSGVRVNKLAGSGSSAGSWRNQTASEWQAGLAALGSDLFVYMDGPNSQSATVVQSIWGQYVDELVTRVRAAVPISDILLVTPPENARTDNRIPISAYAAEGRKRAVAGKYAYYDLQPAFGDGGNAATEYGPAGTTPLFNVDLLHPEPSTGGRLIMREMLKLFQGSDDAALKAFQRFASSNVLAGQPIGSTTNFNRFKDAVTSGLVKVAFVGHSIMEGENQNWREAKLSKIAERLLRQAFPEVGFTFTNFGLGGRLAENFSSPTYVGLANDNSPATGYYRAPASNSYPAETWVTPDLSISGSTLGKSWNQQVKDYSPDLVFFLMDLNENSQYNFITAMQAILTDFQTPANWGGSAPSVVLGTSHTGVPSQAGQSRTMMLKIHRAIRGLAEEFRVPYFDGGRVYELITTGKDHAGGYDVVGEAGFRYDGAPGATAAFSLNPNYWSLEGGFTSSTSSVISPTGSTVRANPSTADFRAYRKRPAYDGRIRASITATSTSPQYELFARRDPNNAFNLSAEQISLRLSGTTLSLVARYNNANNTLATATVPGISNGSVHIMELECVGSRIIGRVNGKEWINVINHHVQHEGWWGFGQPVNGQAASFNVGSNPITSGFHMEFMDPAQVFTTGLLPHSDLVGRLNDFSTNPDSPGGNSTVHLTTAANMFVYSQALAPVIKALQTSIAQNTVGDYEKLDSSLLALIGWNSTLYPIKPMLRGIGTQKVGYSGLSVQALFPNYSSRPTYWVDVSKADDSGDGLTEATAKRTIARAVELANTGGVPARIRVKAGFYDINRLFCQGGVYPIVDIVFEAYGGRAIVTTQANSLVWTSNTTYSWVTQATTTNVSTVWDTKTRDLDGFYGELSKLNTLIDVSAVPNSWAEVGGILYIHRADRTVASYSNTRVLRATDNLRMQGSSQQSILLIGENPGDGFDLEGGQAGCWRTIYTGGAGSANVVQAAVGCTFRYGGHSTGAIGNVAIEGLNGLLLLEDCDASNGVTDCYNYHNVLGANMHILHTNCSGNRGGKFSYVSCNGFTGHDSNIKLVDICGYYERNRGRTIHMIDSAKALLFGTTAKYSLGDKVAVGSNEPGELTSEDTALLIANLCEVVGLGGKLSVGAYDTSTISLVETPVRGAKYSDAGASIVTSN